MAKGDKIRLDTLRVNEKNPRRISGPAMDRLMSSIKRDKRFMELRPIIVDEEGVILGGNQRYRALLALEYAEVPASWIRVASGLSEAQRKRFMVIDNAPEGSAGYWDFEMLQNEFTLVELDELGFEFAEKINFEEHWQGMPEFEQKKRDDLLLYVRFDNEADIAEFARRLDIKLSMQRGVVKTIWYPDKDLDSLDREYEYVEDQA